MPYSYRTLKYFTLKNIDVLEISTHTQEKHENTAILRFFVVRTNAQTREAAETTTETEWFYFFVCWNVAWFLTTLDTRLYICVEL